jgi:hypothetical protein
MPALTSQTRRVALYLGLCLAFAAALLGSLLVQGASLPETPACTEGTIITQVRLVPGAAASADLAAIVRPAMYPNVAAGDEPGCGALYRSDGNGTTWTPLFARAGEQPEALLVASSQLYLLSESLSFPLTLTGNLYRTDAAGALSSWTRISPQGEGTVPIAAITDLLVAPDGVLLARASNGDGAALLRSVDQGATWSAVVIPNLLSVGSVAVVGTTVVTPPAYTPHASPGVASDDGGLTWYALHPLPSVPSRTGLQAVLGGNDVERRLILSLVPRNTLIPDQPVARYASVDGGRSWQIVRCGARPAPGCATDTLWAQTIHARYVLYQGHLFSAALGSPWLQLPIALPVAPYAVQQVLAVSGRQGDTIYLVSATGIWRFDGGHWRNSAAALHPGGPAPEAS